MRTKKRSMKWSNAFPFRRAAIFTLLVLAALNGFWGSRRLMFCTDDAATPLDYVGFLRNLSLFWGTVSGLLLLLGLALLYAPIRAAAAHRLSRPRGRLAFVGAATVLVIGGLISALGITNIESTCIQPVTWMFINWSVLGIIVVMLVYPQFAGRLMLSLFSLTLTLIMLEGGTRLIMRMRPFYDFQYLKPHPVVGWTNVPNTTYTWKGTKPTCISYSNDFSTNSLGFVDQEHSPEKPANTIRIGVFGDSFVEALQVPYEKRATQVLEQRLDAEYFPLDPDQPKPTFEVLNFGVSNYSTGQLLLVWQEFGVRFGLDYAVVRLHEVVMDRTEQTLFQPTGYLDPRRDISVRPAFRLSSAGILYKVDPTDYEHAMQIYATRVDDNGQPILYPIYLVPHKPITWADWRRDPYDQFINYSQFGNFLSWRLTALWQSIAPALPGVEPQDVVGFDRGDGYRALQYAILAQMANEVRANGGKLVIIDDTESPNMSEGIEQFARQQGIVYANLRQQIVALLHEGQEVTYLCDGHYNEVGQRAFGDAMFKAITEDLTKPLSIYDQNGIVVFDQHTGEWHVYRIENGGGIYVAAFRPSELSADDYRFEAEDGWSVSLTRERGGYRMRVFDPRGRLVDDGLVFLPQP